MIDLSSSEVWLSTRQKAGNWAAQEYVRKGGLTLWDAANLLSPYGFGGIYKTCSRSTQIEICGFYEALRQSVKGPERLFEGYAPLNVKPVREPDLALTPAESGPLLDVYPVVAFQSWYRRTRIGDGRYFEINPVTNAEISNTAPQINKKAFQSGSAPTFPFKKYSGPYALEEKSIKAFALAHRANLSVEEFAAIYCGLDLDKLRDGSSWNDNTYRDVIQPLVDLVEDMLITKEQSIDFDDSIPF